MREIFRRSRVWIAGAVLPAMLAGCQAPPATMELIAVARQALDGAAASEKERQAETGQRLRDAQAALDAAFDADARLAEAGRIADPSGQPVALSAEWVISARRGYAAARDALTDNARRADAACVTRLDNLASAAEALDMAGNLILLQYSITERARQILLSAQRRFINGR